ncbi:MAG: hypothetical protein R3341_10370 [Methylophaga sp.]|nr:hypothetical protein [Methylophaga sp.]
MNRAADLMVTLFHWNILILPSDTEIFVGLRQRPETVPPFAPPDDADRLQPFVLHNSSEITEFNTQTGVGFDNDGKRYVLLGPPSDPTNMIRFSINQMMQADNIRWKHDFAD